MIFTIYDPPDISNSKTWGELCVGTIVDVSSWEYEGQFCGVGTFELVVPVGAEGVDKLKLDRFLMCGDGGFIIKQLEFGAEEVQVAGYDLNGLLLNRLTVAKTEDGKDKQSGSTEAIVKHYVAANCVSSADEGRNFPGFVVAANQNRGIANDAASPRLQVVGDVISDILSAQKMGWRITAIGTEAGYTGSEKFLFDVISAIDRTWNQTANDPVSFSYGLGTVDSMKSEQSSADARNTLYCELADGTVQTYSPPAQANNSGYSRTEDFASLSCELSELSIYAEHEIADRFAAINNVTIEHIDPSQWGTKIHLGDIVTVYDKHIGLNSNDHTLEALITAVKVKRANGESEISITIGGTRPKLIDRVSKDVGVVSKNVGDVSSKTKETTAQLQERITIIEKGGASKTTNKLVYGQRCLEYFGYNTSYTETYKGTSAYDTVMTTVKGYGGKLSTGTEGGTYYADFVMANSELWIQSNTNSDTKYHGYTRPLYRLLLGTDNFEIMDYRHMLGLVCNNSDDGMLRLHLGNYSSGRTSTTFKEVDIANPRSGKVEIGDYYATLIISTDDKGSAYLSMRTRNANGGIKNYSIFSFKVQD